VVIRLPVHKAVDMRIDAGVLNIVADGLALAADHGPPPKPMFTVYAPPAG
jgi:hypothetical protein